MMPADLPERALTVWHAFLSHIKPCLVYFRPRRGDRSDYFMDAVIVYAWLADAGAKRAALVCARRSTRGQRTSMLLHVTCMGQDLSRLVSVSGDHAEFPARLKELKARIEQMNWDSAQESEESEKIPVSAGDYLSALDQGDYRIFERKYPDLFNALK